MMHDDFNVSVVPLSRRLRDAIDFGPVKYGHAGYVEKLLALVPGIVALEAHTQSIDAIQKLADKLCNSQPDPYDDAYNDSTPYLTMRRQIGRELKKALGGGDAPTKARNGSINPAPEATA